MTETQINNPKIVSRAEWIEARQKLLEEEKQLTRARDAVNAKRRALPKGETKREEAIWAIGCVTTIAMAPEVTSIRAGRYVNPKEEEACCR